MVRKADDIINEYMEEKQRENKERKRGEAQGGSEAAARTAADVNPEAEVEVDGVEAVGETITEKDGEGETSPKRKDNGRESQENTKEND